MRKIHGIAKVMGSVAGVSGALVFAFMRGPPVKFILKWYISSNNNQVTNHHATEHVSGSSGDHWVKGSLLMLSSNALWSLWLVLQVRLSSLELSFLYTHTKKENIKISIYTHIYDIFTVIR